MLEPTFPNENSNHVQSPPPPVDIEGKLEYEISEIVDSKIDKRRSCKLLYLVHWLGYKNTDEELSWLPAMELKHADELISDFHSAYTKTQPYFQVITIFRTFPYPSDPYIF